jgi:hypothetical protein
MAGTGVTVAVGVAGVGVMGAEAQPDRNIGKQSRLMSGELEILFIAIMTI